MAFGLPVFTAYRKGSSRASLEIRQMIRKILD